MGYRGEDLDLRTPQTWSAAAPDVEPMRQRAPNAAGSSRGGPIWVDDIVLAASNHAFDVALAHRSNEVRLEHLLHALTRVDAAAEMLEAFGVRVLQLRRDSATVIASELPVGFSGAKTAPRRSEELEDVLRLAASNAASRRNAPAAVEDVLQVMLEASLDVPGLHLLHRNIAARPSTSNSYAEIMPPMVRNPYTYDPVDMSRERLRSGYTTSETLMRGAPQGPRDRIDYAQVPVDTVQNSRLDALEQMVRSLGVDLQNERKMLSTVLQDVQREVGLQRDDAARISGGLHERLQSSLGDRLQALETAVMTTRGAGGTADLAPMFDRLQAIERSLQAVAASNQRTTELVNEKLAGLAGTRGGTVDLTPLLNRLDIIEEAVLTRETEPVAFAGLNERLEGLDSLLAGERRRSSEMQTLISDLRSAAASGTGAPINLREQLAPITDRVTALATALGSRDQEAARDLASLKERLLAVEKAVAGAAQKSLELAQASEARAIETNKAHNQELSEVHEALMKLNANQHTLAGSVDQWRKEASGTLGGIADRMNFVGATIDGFGSRMTTLEREAGKPMQLLEQMSGTMDNMHRVTVERYHRRNRFFYWLFGTDDWLSASWPSQAQRIADELQAVKGRATQAKV